jgi:hypothetical protein
MQLRLRFLLSSAGLMLLSQAPVAGAVTLVPMEEPVSTLVSPGTGPFIPSMQYAFAGTSLIATTVTSTPLLCANTSAPLVAGTTLNPVYFSATGSGSGSGQNPARPFVFGASSASPSASALASGATNVAMSPTSMTFSGDALGSLVCYGLDSSGARRVTRDVFFDGMDGTYNSTVALSVFHIPDAGNPYYSYTIDVTVPPLPAGTNCSAAGLDCNFVVEEGYDTALFATNTGGWCLASAGTTSCQGPTTAGDINMTVVAPVAPAAAATLHFVVYRSFQTGVTSLPASGAPVALAALFSPNDLEENKLDDNVSAGNNQIANAAPSVAQDAAFTSFAGSLAALSENTDSGTMTFDISDSDTAESGGATLGAAVTLNLPGSISVPLTANCPTLLSSPGATPVSRACTIDIPLNNGAFWNAQVGTALDGGFNVLATDTTNGSYANGLSANASIVVTDPLGKASAPVAVPLHIHSTVNNPPAVAFGGGMPVAQDSKQGGTSYPTYSCSIQTNNCGATFHVVELDGLVTALPGPAAALDELASQTTAVLDVQCGLSGENNAIFTNAPVVTQSAGSPTSYDVIFQLTSPPTAGSSLCSVSFTDQANSFPNGQTAKTAAKQFRVVVNT